MWHFSILILAAVGLVLMIGMMWHSRIAHPTRRILSVVFTVQFFWTICLAFLGKSPAVNHLWLYLSIAAFGFGLGLLRFYAIFPIGATVQRRVWYLLAFVGIVAITCISIVIAGQHTSILSGIQPAALRVLTLAAPYWMLMCLMIGIIYLWCHRRRVHGQARLQLYYVLTGLLCFFVGGVYDGLIWGTTLPFTMPLLGVLSSILLTYALFHSPLRRLDQLLRIWIVNLLTICVLSVLFGTFLVTVERYLVLMFSFPFRVGNYVLALFLGLWFDPLRTLIRRLSHRLYPPDGPRTQAIVNETLQGLKEEHERQVLLGLLARATALLFNPKGLAIYLPLDQEQFTRVVAIRTNAALPTELATSEPVTQYLRYAQKPLLHELLRYHPGTARGCAEAVLQWDVAVSVTLQVAGNVQGLLLLGEKGSGGAYAAEDLSRVQLLCEQAAEALARAVPFEELATKNDALEQTVTQQHVTLAQTASRLQRYDRANDRFLAILSHELLTPLTVILGWSEIATLKNDPTSKDKALSIISEAAHRQKSLVDDLLDASRLNYDKLELMRKHTDLWQLACASVEALQQRIEKQQLSVVLQTPNEPLPVFADPNRMAQVISNLLNNAIKFTPSGGTITLQGGVAHNQAYLTVQDTGQGILKEDLEIIFQLFEQGGTPDMHGPGLGLGLALVKGLVTLHNGQISASSPGRGLGSTFRIELPLDIPDAMEQQPTHQQASPSRSLTSDMAKAVGVMGLQ